MNWEKLKQICKSIYIGFTTGITIAFFIFLIFLQYPTVIFYKGVVDAYANMISDKLICRSINVYAVLHDVITQNATRFYLILDKHHIRGYFDGKFYDLTSPSYKFYPHNTTIIECILTYNEDQVIPNCYPVYSYGFVLKRDVEEVLEALTTK